MNDTLLKIKKNVMTVFTYTGLIFFAFIFAFPFYYMIVLSTVPSESFYSSPPPLIPGNYLIHNIQGLFERIPFHLNFMNSLGISVIGTALVLFFCTMGGFALSKYEFKGKNFMFMFMLGTMTIPITLSIIPFYQMMRAFGWVGTWLPLVIPGMANGFGIVLMTQFMKNSIPLDLLDAARIDGLSELGILFRIIFPLAKPGMSILGIVSFVGSWNNFFGALIFLPSIKETTIPVALSKLSSNALGEFAIPMAGTLLAVIPLSIVFIFFSRRIISGLTAGAVKG
jgi:multiple sugar transport system permease protein